MIPVTYQPPLRWWNHLWRYALAIAISAVAWFEAAQWQWDHARWWFWTDLAMGLVGFAILPWRRRHPLAVALAANALALGSWSVGGPATLALVSLSTRRRLREILPVTAVALVAGLVLEATDRDAQQTYVVMIPLTLLVLAVTVGWGMFIGSRRELIATLRERARAAEDDQASRVARARTAERSRIAREMHDVLAHRISLVTMHAGALAYRDDLSRDEVRATAGIIQDNSHQAMVELREVLGILRDGPGDSAPERPQPSATDVAGLVDEARRSGMRVELGGGIALSDVPDALGRTVYRIVQEALTNARKHAADTLVSVIVTGSPDAGVTVEVRNPLRVGEQRSAPPRSGLGLEGLTERAELAGGRLGHRISPDAEFVLEAWLPWPA
ncbi:sensor histidine kinase [Aeromicrobium endophyticum]|uniref:histidine kinase n=1 Tax=Aeromicrobium endophyticum TaxID=2292704 RepID=A0A371P1M7_9ACTN|nr:histidine kinase [Aeromicrobium endophyticum]REK69791.1 two-component sensor histidine kinase [Aeromicrobium endophyticum]